MTNQDYFRPAERREHGYRRDYNDRYERPRFERREPENPHKNNRFGQYERYRLRECVSELGQNWEDIGKKLDRSPYDCQRQWLFWDYQPDWTDEKDTETAIRMYNEESTVQEIADALNRSAIGVRAKLQIMNNNQKLTRPFEPEGEETPFLIKLVLRSERLIDLGKELYNCSRQQKRSVAEIIAEIQQRIEQSLYLIDDQYKSD